jgi:hypothetical protein
MLFAPPISCPYFDTLEGMEATHNRDCQLCCCLGLLDLTGPLDDLACSLLGRLEMELLFLVCVVTDFFSCL